MSSYKSIGNIIAIIHRYTQIYFMKELEDINLYGPGQIRIVLTLAKYKKGITQDELAKSLLVDKASISRMIRPLVSQGFVERYINPEDHRAYIVKISDNIKARIPEIRLRARKWTNILRAGFSPQDLEKLFFYMGKIIKNAQSYIKEEKTDEKKQD